MLKITNHYSTPEQLNVLFKRYGEPKFKFRRDHAVVTYDDNRTAFVAQQKLNNMILSNGHKIQVKRYPPELNQIESEEERQFLREQTLRAEELKSKQKDIEINQVTKQGIMQEEKIITGVDLLSQALEFSITTTQKNYNSYENRQIFEDQVKLCQDMVASSLVEIASIMKKEREKIKKQINKCKDNLLNEPEEKIKINQMQSFCNNLRRLLKKAKNQQEISLGRISKQLQFGLKKRNIINLEERQRRKPQRLFNDFKQCKEELEYQNLSNNPIKRLLAISNTDFAATFQDSTLKLYNNQDFIPFNKISFQKVPYAMALWNNQIIVGDRKGQIYILHNTNPTIVDPNSFRIYPEIDKEDPIIDIKLFDQKSFFCCSRQGIVKKFSIQMEQILADYNSCQFYQDGQFLMDKYIYSMDIMSRNELIFGQDGKINIYDIQKGHCQSKIFNKRVNKVAFWRENVASICTDKLVHMIDTRARKDLLTFQNIKGLEVCSVAKISEFKLGYGACATFGLLDVRFPKNDLWVNCTSHTDYVKDIVCMNNEIITGGIDSKIFLWKVV